MNKFKTLTLFTTSLLVGASTQASVVATWDFDTFTTPSSGTTFTIAADSTTVGASLLALSTSSGTNMGSVAGTTVNSLDDTASFAMNLRRGERWNGNTTDFTNPGSLTLSFDASAITYNVVLSFAANHNSNGPTGFRVAYSTDYDQVTPTWTAASDVINLESAWTAYTIEGITGIHFDNSPNAAFRISFTADGGLASNSGGNTLDNIQLTTVPEPSTYVFVLGFLALSGVIVRHKIRR